jgi:deazaflavin-dependent oxidoreductase (nitroreductase family)
MRSRRGRAETLGGKLEKRRLTSAFARYAFNPLVKAAIRAGVASRGWAILETTGRESGKPRRNPVGNGLDGDTFWIVAEHGRRAGYVRNIEANPRVRVKVGGRWRSGVAQVMPEDDPLARQRRIGRRLNAAFVRAMATDLLTVRIDLDRGS